MKVYLTTSYHPSLELEKRAAELAKKLALPFFIRGSKSMKEYWAENEYLLICEEKRLVLANKEGQVSFHPNMAKLRLLNIKKGKPDHLLQSLNLAKGDRFLDCTAGLGGDSLTVSWFLEDKVEALEIDPLIYAITSHGLQNYVDEDEKLTEAMRRVAVKNIDYASFLKQQGDGSYDVIYFDPMFDKSIAGSISLEALRNFAFEKQLDKEVLEEALRVAQKRVVVKNRAGCNLLKDLGCPLVKGGRYSRIQYGIWEKP